MKISSRNNKLAAPKSDEGRSRKSSTSGRPPGHHPSSTIHHPRYALTKHIAFWHLTFNGQNATFKHEQGAFYVAYLLLNPPSEPIHGMGLELKASAYFRQLTGETIITESRSARNIIIPSDAELVQRNLVVDELESAHALHREIRKLEALLGDADVIEPVKAEVMRELVTIYAFQRQNPLQVTDQAQKTVRAVRMAIVRFHRHLATAYTPDGTPDAVLRQFAFHLQRYLLVPSARYTSFGRARTRTGVAGCFTYDPSSIVQWEA